MSAANAIPSSKTVHAAAASESRFDYIDHAKAIGIILIMMGHSPGLPALAHHLIFSFHVPLFYFLSGFLFGHRKLEQGVAQFVRGVLRSQLLPYSLFFLAAYGYWLCTRSIGPRAGKFAGMPWFEPLRGLGSGLGEDLFICPPLWFFPSLILTSLSFYGLRRAMSAGATVLIAICLGLLDAQYSQQLPWRLPWGLDTLGVALSFYAAGHYLRERISFVQPVPGIAPRLSLAVLLAALWAASALATNSVDINMRQFTGHPLAVVPIALAGIGSLLLWCTVLPRNSLSLWLSRHTLFIFPLHPILFNVISGIRKLVLATPNTPAIDHWWPLVYTTLALLATVPIVRTVDAIKARLDLDGRLTQAHRIDTAAPSFRSAVPEDS